MDAATRLREVMRGQVAAVEDEAVPEFARSPTPATNVIVEPGITVIVTFFAIVAVAVTLIVPDHVAFAVIIPETSIVPPDRHARLASGSGGVTAASPRRPHRLWRGRARST